MTDYRRRYVPNAVYFFTVVTYERRKFLASVLARSCLRQAIRHVRKRWPFQVVAMVLLPDHLHNLWQLPKDDVNFGLHN